MGAMLCSADWLCFWIAVPPSALYWIYSTTVKVCSSLCHPSPLCNWYLLILSFYIRQDKNEEILLRGFLPQSHMWLAIGKSIEGLTLLLSIMLIVNRENCTMLLCLCVFLLSVSVICGGQAACITALVRNYVTLASQSLGKYCTRFWGDVQWALGAMSRDSVPCPHTVAIKRLFVHPSQGV